MDYMAIGGNKSNLRILPALVVNLVLEATLLVIFIDRCHLEHFSLVKQLVMEAQSLLILFELGLRSCCWCHVCGDVTDTGQTVSDVVMWCGVVDGSPFRLYGG